ncbi:hypothetical protein KAFR_0G00750 [Kazachstania africana CBS 2517]|uniref:Sodium/calcium exchanger membrane region domain-containing protein n=1 Tax=Kazachstania africana (strain ATCC 22294 / BCRC 22015 / CBS 2517 / CECT 1963 / NBRC 1671 / NRRL Y-8276) TaxID=1071382 RepID=H2AXK8_KAZAF|nr:hypothetical protein KAFR_0G00750 [Kazachstania africana CBS 2517]CCF59108.1 hypothetical protein KAFR_0G00750 [Kazachstania africana CBS 2517]
MSWLLKLTHPSLLYPDAALSLSFCISSISYIILCFVLLGLCASEYLCPNVANIAERRSNRVKYNTGAVMAVLLSWCNSSPDLFSNFMTWTTSNTTTSAALSVGEILGACGIILCIVEGSIFIIMSNTTLSITKNQQVAISKDLAFTFVAIFVMFYISLRNRITVLNCFLMLSIYTLYIVTKLSSSNYTPEMANEGFDEENLLPSRSIDQLNSGIKPSIISAMDYNSLLSMLENSPSNNSVMNAEELVSLQQNDAEDVIVVDPIRPSSEPLPNSTHPPLSSNIRSAPATFKPYHDFPEEEAVIMAAPNTPEQVPIIVIDPPKSEKAVNMKKLLVEMFFPHMLNFSQKSKIDASLCLITAPFIFILQLSCPQTNDLLEFDKASGKFIYSTLKFILLLIQSLICPLISFAILSCLLAKSFPMFFWFIPFSCSISLFGLVLNLYRTLQLHNTFSLFETTSGFSIEAEEKNKRRRMLDKMNDFLRITFLSIGIFNSILYISLLANSLIEMLELYQILTGVSKAILGLTIFAWGNSVGDLISNIAMCRLYLKFPHQEDAEQIQTIATKFFVISCTSCLGGVMLNSMAGLGFSGLVSMMFIHKQSDEWWFLRFTALQETANYNYTFIISCLTIILQILLMILIFNGPSKVRSWFRERMKISGLIMCGLWGIATLCNVMIEIFSH